MTCTGAAFFIFACLQLRIRRKALAFFIERTYVYMRICAYIRGFYRLFKNASESEIQVLVFS